LKLPQLLSQYLYQTRKLDLPGIGSFTLDAGAVIPQESDRLGQQPATGISFKNASIHTPDDALILFIKEHTGKMKSLVASDLDFYLTTGRQLLNIGKAFYIEGVGTLLKNKEGRLDFTPGDYLVAKLEDKSGAERKGNSYDEPPREEPKSSNGRQTLLLIGLVAGLVLIGWGGYYLYKRNNYTEPSTENRATVLPDSPSKKAPDTLATTPAATDTLVTAGKVLSNADTAKADASAAKPAAAQPTTTAPKPAATAPVVPPPSVPVGQNVVPTAGQELYRFVILQTANKGHALRRYNQLLGYQLNIRMDQKDSSFFKLYFPIAARPRDTTGIKDSIADVYASKVSIEH
jgi:cell division septation protein DedD